MCGWIGESLDKWFYIYIYIWHQMIQKIIILLKNRQTQKLCSLLAGQLILWIFNFAISTKGPSYEFFFFFLARQWSWTNHSGYSAYAWPCSSNQKHIFIFIICLFIVLLTADHSLKPLGCFYILRLLKKITTLFCSLCTGHLIVNLTEYFFLYITTCLLFVPSLTNTFLPTSCQIPSFITTFVLNIGSLT